MSARIRSVDDASGIVTLVGNHTIVSHMRTRRVSQSQTLKHQYDSSAGPTYHPSSPCGDHVSRLAGFSCATTRTPGGASGVRLKSKCPWKYAHADNLGLSRDPRRRLRVMTAWSMSRSHKCKGKSLSTLHNPAMK
jgi:hypothetical protein